MYAVIQSGGKQYRVSEGSVLKVEKIEAEQGSSIDLDKVLMVADGEDIKMGKHFAHHFTRIGILYAGTYRNRQNKILTLLASHLAAHTILPSLRLLDPYMTKINQRVQARVTDEVDTTPIAAVTTIGTTPGDIFFPAETHTAIASVTGHDFYSGFVNKFHMICEFPVSGAKRI